MGPETETADSGIDMDSAVSDIASGLGIEISDEAPDPVEADDEAPVAEEVAAEPEAAAPVVTREMPKSWSKDKAEMWSKLPADAQDYYQTREKQFLDGLEQYKGDATFARELKDVVSPYKAFLTAQGVNEKQAVQYLLNAHFRLSSGTSEERQAAYKQLGQELGLVQGQQIGPVDPIVKKLQDDLNSVKSTVTAREQAELREAQTSATREIEAFAADLANVHFRDVGQDMIPLLQAGHSLKDAYDKAVWANPVTRQKELNRIQTESVAKFKATAKTEAEAARKATSSNVRSAESRKAPTEPKGEMFSDMADILAGIKKKSH